MSVIMIINVVSITLISFWCPSPKKFKNKHKNTIILSSLAIQVFLSGRERQGDPWEAQCADLDRRSTKQQHRLQVGKNMGKWKRLKEAFRLSENLKESFRNLLARIGGEGERWGTDTPISRYEQNPPGWRSLDPPRKRWNRRGMNWNLSRLSSCN